MELITSHLLLRAPNLLDAEQIVSLHMRNETYWRRWEPKVESPQLYLDYLQTWVREHQEKKAVRFFIFHRDNPKHLIGYSNFSQIIWGFFQACYLGYKIDQEFEGKGLMHEALQAAIQHIFEQVHLHRIMANYMPDNVRSGKLLDRLGFEQEGYAKNYLLINGKWEDHVLTALNREKWEAFKTASPQSNF